MTPHASRTCLLLLGLGLGLAGCSQFEPFQRTGTWHQNQAPMHNIAIELANPADLYRGSSHPVLTGDTATAAIDTVLSATDAAGATAGSSGTTASASSASGGSATGSAGTGGGIGAGGNGMGSAGGSVP